MEAIPGSTQVPSGTPVGADTSQKPISAWAAVGRWASRYGDGVKPEPFTPAIARGVRLKKQWDENPKQNIVPFKTSSELALACATGAQLLAGARRGQKYSFPLHQRGVKLTPPSDEQQLKTLGHLWHMRGTIVIVLGWIVTAMQVMKRPGLRATHAELGALCGVGEDRIGQIMHELRRYGLVAQLPSFEAFGAVTSQRANVYRVTTLAFDTYALKLVRGTLPAPESVAPRIARARQGRNELRPTPGDTPVEIPPSGESSARARASDRPTRFEVVSTSSMAVPNESVCLFNAKRVNERTAASSDGALRREAVETAEANALLCPGAEENAQLELAVRIGDVVEGVKHGVVRDHREIDPDDTTAIDRHRAYGRAVEVNTERKLLEKRAREIDRELAERGAGRADADREKFEREQRQRGAKRERDEEKARRELLRRQVDERMPPAKPVDDDGNDWKEVARLALIKQHREELERDKAERAARAAIAPPPPPKKSDDDADVADVIQRVWESNPHVGAPTIAARQVLEKMRRGDK